MATLFEDLRREIARMEEECPDSWLLPHLKRQLRGLEAANGRTPKDIFLNGVRPSAKSDELFRQTFGHMPSTQPDGRIDQAAQPWTTEELNAAGIPENLHAQATWWSTLEEMREDLGLPGPSVDH